MQVQLDSDCMILDLDSELKGSGAILIYCGIL